MTDKEQKIKSDEPACTTGIEQVTHIPDQTEDE